MVFNRLIVKVTKFHFPTSKHFSTVVKNILGGDHASPSLSNFHDYCQLFCFLFETTQFVICDVVMMLDIPSNIRTKVADIDHIPENSNDVTSPRQHKVGV